MAASNKIAFHAHSISLPTNSHPLTLAVEEQLCRLRSSELATSSASSISNNLTGLKDLYECVEDFLQLESIQQANSIEGVLDGSVMLLDVCGIARDVLAQMKHCVQDLQSSIRRRTNDTGAYITSRKKITKVIRKCLSDLKRMSNKNNDLVAEVNVLREVETATLAVFESLLSFVAGPKQNRSLVSKLMPTKWVAHNGDEETTEVMKVDIALEKSIQDIEDGLESVYRCLIKNRVSLLNIFNQ